MEIIYVTPKKFTGAKETVNSKPFSSSRNELAPGNSRAPAINAHKPKKAVARMAAMPP
jgi:hypothetical protein